MDTTVIKANKSLEDAVHNLQAQVAKQEKMLQLCLQVISEFGHFVPSIVEDFKYEMRKLDDDGAVGSRDDEDNSDESYPIYTNLNEDGSISSED